MTEPTEQEVAWVHKFINCMPFGANAPADDMTRAHNIVEVLSSRLAAERKDAERYRWLRNDMPRPTDMRDSVWLRTGDDLDEAIDAAIAEKYQMTDWDEEQWIMFGLFGAIGLIVIGLIAAMIYESFQPTFSLTKSEWRCSSSHTETILMPTYIGNTTYMLPQMHSECDQWSRK